MRVCFCFGGFCASWGGGPLSAFGVSLGWQKVRGFFFLQVLPCFVYICRINSPFCGVGYAWSAKMVSGVFFVRGCGVGEAVQWEIMGLVWCLFDWWVGLMVWFSMLWGGFVWGFGFVGMIGFVLLCGVVLFVISVVCLLGIRVFVGCWLGVLCGC